MGSGCAWPRICAAWRTSRSPNDRVWTLLLQRRTAQNPAGKLVVAPLKRGPTMRGSYRNFRLALEP